jgi:hypothetical protein
MGIGEKHSFTSQAINVGSGNSRLGIVAGHVAVTEIIGQDEYHVGQLRHQEGRTGKQKEERKHLLVHEVKIG